MIPVGLVFIFSLSSFFIRRVRQNLWQTNSLKRFIASDTLVAKGKFMPTKNPRLNVVLEPGLYKALSKIAHKEGISLSLLARDLLKESLELHEDIFWNEVARKRDKTFSYKEALSHKDIWK